MAPALEGTTSRQHWIELKVLADFPDRAPRGREILMPLSTHTMDSTPAGEFIARLMVYSMTLSARRIRFHIAIPFIGHDDIGSWLARLTHNFGHNLWASGFAESSISRMKARSSHDLDQIQRLVTYSSLSPQRQLPSGAGKNR